MARRSALYFVRCDNYITVHKVTLWKTFSRAHKKEVQPHKVCGECFAPWCPTAAGASGGIRGEVLTPPGIPCVTLSPLQLS